MKTLATLVVSALILVGVGFAGAAPAASVTTQAAHRCTWTIDWDWHTSTAPNWSQVDWEASTCGYEIQQGSWCGTRTGVVLVKSGIVTAIELEARATCTNTERLTTCAYRMNKGSGWGSWVTDCNPPRPSRKV